MNKRKEETPEPKRKKREISSGKELFGRGKDQGEGGIRTTGGKEKKTCHRREVGDEEEYKEKGCPLKEHSKGY